ncbi:MAG: hypothetical protein JSR46_05300 [Verrucomicrobia bacterium]|nr:hypothetical protein [Verrucomicrobiota bacterium]
MGNCIQHCIDYGVFEPLVSVVQETAQFFASCSARVQKVAEEAFPFAAQLASLFVSNHVLLGLCKITGYEVLRHGTSWSSYLSILQHGVDLSRGGETTEMAACQIGPNVQEYATNARRKFYVTRDTEDTGMFSPSDDLHKTFGVFSSVVSDISSCVIPSYHAFLAYIKEYKKLNGLGPKDAVPLWVKKASQVCAIFTPKIRFIYSLEEIHGRAGYPAVFENDREYEGAAYRTSESLPNHRIGLLGLAMHAKREHILTHIANNPGRVALGVAQVALGVLLTAVGLGIVY